MSNLNSSAIARQGVGFGALSMALQGFFGAATAELFSKYVSTIYSQPSQQVVFAARDSLVIYRAPSKTSVEL
jgi:hypothetical protein